MKRQLLIAAAVAATSIGSVYAADLPARGPAPAPIFVQGFSWTGFYVGANIGYGWGQSKTRTALDPTSSWAVEAPAFRTGWAALSNGTTNPSGVLGGIQAGYNYQMNSIVLGLEADINLSGMKGNSTTFGAPTPPGPPTYTWMRSAKNDWFLTLRPRIGVTFDRTLVYVTGGLAVGDIKGDWSVLGSNGYSKAGSVNKTKAGWTIGGGVEQAINQNWSVKLEYLYTDLGRVDYASFYRPGSTFAPPGANYRELLSQDLKFHTVRVGVNYRFGGPAGAVVAKY